MGRGTNTRTENFGRYDPVNHLLLIDRDEYIKPGVTSHPIAISVSEKGRLHSVLHCNDEDVLSRARRSGVPMVEPATQTHEHHRRNVARPDKFGRYDPLTSSLTFQTQDGAQHSVRVGDKGRLRSVFESGKIDRGTAKELGLPPPPPASGRRKPTSMDDTQFNPLTHEYKSSTPSANVTPRDWAPQTGRRNVDLSLTPRFNPLTQRVDPLASSPEALRRYNPRVLPTFDPQDTTRWLCRANE